MKRSLRIPLIAVFLALFSMTVIVGSAWEKRSPQISTLKPKVFALAPAKNPLLKQANYFVKKSLLERMRVRKA